jgi:hypothetical protein
MTANPTTRIQGKTKIDSLWVDSSAWYIDGSQVTASASDLNVASGTYTVYNDTGGAFTAGMALHISGFDTASGLYKVEKADADNSKPAQLFAVTTTASGSTGEAKQYYYGNGNGVNTSGASVGDPVYLSASSGLVTLTAPTAVNSFQQVVGRVATVAATGVLDLNSDFQEMTKIGTNEIQSSSLGIAQMANDDKASTFVIFGEHDFNVTTAVDTDLGTLGAKGTLIGGYVVLTEALNGTATSTTITFSTAATGGTPIATAHTITKANTADGQSNIAGATRGLAPLAAGVDIASTAHIYVYTPADTGSPTRSTGKAQYMLVFLKSA